MILYLHVFYAASDFSGSSKYELWDRGLHYCLDKTLATVEGKTLNLCNVSLGGEQTCTH